MKSLWNKTLLKKEFKTARWISLLMTLGLLMFKVLNVINRLSYENNFLKVPNSKASEFCFNHILVAGGNSYRFFLKNDVSVMFFCLFMLSVLLFQDERHHKTYGLIASMPYKREEVIKNKFIVSIITITIPFIIIFILLSLLYIFNINILNEPYTIILKWTLINWVMYIMFISICIFIQTIIGQNIVGAIIGIALINLPFSLTCMIEAFVRFRFKCDIDIMPRIFYGLNHADQVCVNKINGYVDSYYYTYNNFLLKILIGTVLSFVLYFISIYLYKKNSFELNGNLILFPIIKPIFKIGVAFCVGLFLCLFAGQSSGENKLIMDITLILGIPFGYWIANKSICIFNKNK